MREQLLEKGWATFPAEEAVTRWVAETRPRADAIAADPSQQALWLRCQGTWFAGVNVLPNDGEGRIAQGPPLAGAARALANSLWPSCRLDPGQVSVTYPGYPQPMEGEADAAFNYRLHRDAAHVDGLLPVGPDRRRQPQERHAFILGIALNPAPEAAAPFVVWEHSHEVMRAAFAHALRDIDAQDWPDADLTTIYQVARRHCFEECKRVELPLQPGEALLVHRFALHGISPWRAPDQGQRAIAYFRPDWPGEMSQWLTAP